ncbi:hypothetical protein [Nocardia africana]
MIQKVSETDEYYSGRSPLGSWRDGYTTYREPDDGPIGKAVRVYLERTHANESTYQPISEYVDKHIRHEHLELTVHDCWSGLSEYTITDTWTEVSLKWGPFEAEFDSMAEFFRELSTAEEAAKAELAVYLQKGIGATESDLKDEAA